MTRDKEIKQAAECYYGEMYHKYPMEYFTKGAQWADEHPKNPWRDMKKDPPERELGNKICYTFLDTASDGVHEQRFYHYAEFKKCCFSRKEWLDEDGNLVLVGIADFWMPIPELSKGGEK